MKKSDGIYILLYLFFSSWTADSGKFSDILGTETLYLGAVRILRLGGLLERLLDLVLRGLRDLFLDAPLLVTVMGLLMDEDRSFSLSLDRALALSRSRSRVMLRSSRLLSEFSPGFDPDPKPLTFTFSLMGDVFRPPPRLLSLR